MNKKKLYFTKTLPLNRKTCHHHSGGREGDTEIRVRITLCYTTDLDDTSLGQQSRSM